MLVPGMLFDASGRVITTTSVGQVADFISQGIGMMHDGSVALDSSPAPIPISFCKGIAQNASGACFGAGLSPGTFGLPAVEGIPLSPAGQIVIGGGTPIEGFTSGNPLTPALKFAQVG